MRPSQLPPEQRRVLLSDFRDHATFARECLRIPDLTGSLVPLIQGAGQRKWSAAIRRQKNARRPVRLVALKTRRSWFTAGSCAEIFHAVPFFPGRKGVVISNTYDPAGIEAFGYLSGFHKGYVPFERFSGKVGLPKLKRCNDQEIEWANGSKIDLYSADAGQVRGGGRQFALFDEVAFWRDAETTLTGAMNMVPKREGTMILVVSTANGVGGEYYDLVQLARSNDPDNLFEFVFFGWLEHEVYSEPLKMSGADFQASLDEEELMLMRVHNATLQQLQWRRSTIATEFRGKVTLFRQEYPTTPEEAFLHSGRPALDLQALAEHPIVEPTDGELKLRDDLNGQTMRFVPQPGGYLQVFKKPQPGHRYCLGGDPSRGVDVSAKKAGANPDYSVAFVADADTGEQVALLRGRIRPVAFGKYCALLAKWYNWAFSCIESNDPSTIDAMLNEGYPLERMYHQHRDPTDLNPKAIDEVGFYTDGLSRNWLIGAIDDAIMTMSITIHSHIVVSECQTFVVKPNGKTEHMDDHHDDCVIALGLCEMARRRMPRKEFLSAQREAIKGRVMVGSKKRNRDDDDD